MAGRTVPMLLSAVAGIALGSLATTLLTAPPDHRGELPSAALPPPRPAAVVPAAAPVADPVATPPAPSDEVQILAARQALASRLRSPDALRLVDVRVHAFGPPDERAVCGTMQTAEITGGAARFVVRVLQPREAGTRQGQVVVEEAPWLVRPAPEAARRFCRDPEPEPMPLAAQGTLVQAATTGVTPAVATPADQTALSAGAGQDAGALPASLPLAEGQRGGRVTTQSPANLRAAPQGEVLMSVPRGRSLVVFDRAPGGWMQVGETAPQGWIHSSLLSDLAAQ